MANAPSRRRTARPRRAPPSARRTDELDQLREDTTVANDQRAPGEQVVVALEAGDHAPRLADQDDARGDVPGVDAELPEGVEAAGRDVGEVERARPEPADARDLGRDPVELGQEAPLAALPV